MPKWKKYEVSVIRIGYGSRNIIITARTPQEAKIKAIEEAGDYEFSEHNADYKVEYLRDKNGGNVKCFLKH